MSKSRPRVLVSVINDLNTDQRVHKVCLFIQKQGYEVTLIGRVHKKSLPMESRSYQTHRFHMIFQKGALFYAFYNIRLLGYLLTHRATILVSNDLDTLLPNYLVSKWFGRKLVYDSHEYFTEVPELINRPKIQAIWKSIEKWIFPKLKQVITVNDSIAQKYVNQYQVPITVIRNVSPRIELSFQKSKEELGIPTDKHILIMQGAGLNVDRGVEEAIRMMPLLENAVLIIVGDGDIIPEMKHLVEQQQWQNHVLFFGKRPYLELLQYTKHADLGLSFDQPTNPNYLFSLPNKVFDYMHSGIPILCSNVVEVVNLVEKYSIGEVVTDFSPDQLANQVKSILADDIKLNTWRGNCKKAAAIENWEAESQKLLSFYPKFS